MAKIDNPQGAKSSLQGFRADKELTELLQKLPNKTDFIIDALYEKFSKEELVTCRRCKGTGKVRRKQRNTLKGRKKKNKKRAKY